MSRHFLLLAVFLPAAAVAADCDPIRGGRSFANKCGICHVAVAGAPPTVGPNLHGVVGRAVGREPGFTYSASLAEAGGQWDEARLDAFMAAPDKAMPGTAMPFQGLKSAAERQHLICFLNTLK